MSGDAVDHAMRSPVILLSILALLAVAVVSDLRAHRIPNWLSLFGFAAGLGLQTWFGGAGGILQAALGAGVGLLGFMPLYVLRAMGAGDVKLLMAIGSILGPEATIFAVVFSLLAGGLGAIGFVLWRAVQSAASKVVRGEIAQLGASISVAAMVARRERIPFALPIAVGSLAAWWQQSDCTHIAACLGSGLT